MTLTEILFPRRHAIQQWQSAKDRYEAAVRAGDTRRQHAAFQDLRAATVEKLRVGA